MKNDKFNNSPKSLLAETMGKDRQFVLELIRTKVTRGTGKSLTSLKEKYSEEQLFFVGLKYVTTTKKAICKALGIEIENACRYKRDYEDNGLLVQSADDYRCPYTGYLARVISTCPEEFAYLQNSDDTQLSLF